MQRSGWAGDFGGRLIYHLIGPSRPNLIHSGPKVKRVLIAALALIGAARVAGAQNLRESVAPQAPDLVVTGDTGSASSTDGGPRTNLLSTSGLLTTSDAGPRARDRRWLGNISLEIGSHGLQATARTGTPSGGRRISRTFLAIPVVRWQRYFSLVTPRGYVAITPSLVIGRRQTWAPELARGGRTFGIAVQMRVWLDHPPTTGDRTPRPTTEDRILSTLRAVLDKSGRQ